MIPFIQGGIFMTSERTKDTATKILENSWVKWVHLGLIPAETPLAKSTNVGLGAITNHCVQCRNLNGCCFVKGNHPPHPPHKYCHCELVDIKMPSIKAECAIEKFVEYIFHPVNNKGKKDLFESWGYGIMDSQYLQQEFVRQAQIAYSAGEYELDFVDDYGQRINIEITLKADNGEYVTFNSGWMVYPNGRIVLVTPFGGKIK
ncbi:MAG: hypothetical protein IJF66_04455 [Clostridia bacterium]|nr:hypothetical protein [Clostridia bacterium]